MIEWRYGKGDQDQGKITAIDASRILIDYTYDRVHDKTLPKTDRWLMTKTIWDDAAIARRYIVVSNSIRVESKSEAEERMRLEKLKGEIQNGNDAGETAESPARCESCESRSCEGGGKRGLYRNDDRCGNSY